MYSGLQGIPCWEIKFSALLVRVFICSQEGRSYGWCHWGQCFLEILRAAMARIGISSSWGSCFVSILNVRGPLGSNFPRKTLLDPSGEIQAYPFPRKINFPDFYWLSNPSWYQMGRGREVSFNSSKCLSALIKIFPCGRFKNFKTNKAVLTIVIGLENMLESSKVCFR